MDLGPLRQRSVLAVLLVDANRRVPIDELVGRIWGVRPPQRARETLYSYLSRLRQALAAAGVAILGHSAAYSVEVDPAAVDMHRFTQLVAAARAADDEAAWPLFTQALGLWHGVPFADLDTPWVNGVREMLERERLAATLDRNDCALRLGRHSNVLTELATTAAEHPLDERVAGQLMLALYRSGRSAEALDQYRRIRDRLAEQLGTDPTPALAELHRRILNADPSLGHGPGISVPDRPEPAAAPVPRQLPAPPPVFVGRVAELATISAAILG
ncbi:MAG: AfsR/SARP family transcriptional regulator, partial [Micromonosporaceae bacterium]|nr:AfsR/SARP family transcriptional regulator [Micromonosporaceae bacterium]